MKKCQHCGDEFVHTSNSQKYCSIECKDAYLMVISECPFCSKETKQHRNKQGRAIAMKNAMQNMYTNCLLLVG